MNRLQIPMMTRQSCKTSDVLMGSPPLLGSEGKKLPPVMGADRSMSGSTCIQHSTAIDKKQQKTRPPAVGRAGGRYDAENDQFPPHNGRQRRERKTF